MKSASSAERDVNTIWIHDDNEAGPSRAEYDLWRENPSCEAVCHAPFVSLDLRATGAVAPCPYFSIDCGRESGQSLESIWHGDFLNDLRNRFRDYRVSRCECSECIDYWTIGMAANSPALTDFDALPIPSGLPAVPAMLGLDLRAQFSETDFETVSIWLKQLRQICLTTPWPPADQFCEKILDETERLPAERRPRLRIRICNDIAESAKLPGGIDVVEWDVSSTGESFSEGREKALETIARELRKNGAGFSLSARVNQGNWIHLRSWLQCARDIGTSIELHLPPAPELDSLANLDGDSLGCLHGVCLEWLREYPPDPDPNRASRLADLFLARLRRWQQQAAGRSPQREGLALPGENHPLLRDEKALEMFLTGLLRIYDDPHVERWLLEIVLGQASIKKARSRRSLRFAALWLACVFERSETFPLLRGVFKDYRSTDRLVRKDRKALAGTPLESWFEGWTEQLNLQGLRRRHSVFKTGPKKAGGAGDPAKVTVIIPSYNHEAFIGEAIRSVLAQTRTDFRMLVVDDASGDRTVQEAQKLRDSRVRVSRNSQNLGLGKSLAHALDGVETEFVAILNSDDLFHPQRLRSCLSALEQNHQWSLVATGLNPIDDRGRICSVADSTPVFDGRNIYHWLRWYEEHTRRSDIPSDLFKALLEGNFLLTTSNIVARSDFLRAQVEDWQGLEFCLDWQLFLTAAFHGSLCFLPDLLLGYRLHGSNTVWFDSEHRWRYYLESNQVFARILEQLFQRENEFRTMGFFAVLEAFTGPLSANTVVDWPGVLLGLFLERLRLTPHDLGSGAFVQNLHSMEDALELRRQAIAWLGEFGDSVPQLHRMRGEYPFLRSIRNHHEALNGEYFRLRGEFSGLLFDRANAEKWWRKAEQERDGALTEKGRLYQQVEKIQGELRASRQEFENQKRALTVERNALFQSQERRLGTFILDRLRLRKALNAASYFIASGHHVLTAGRMAAERRSPTRGGARLRALATACSNFPIYSHTFVHQELVQLAKNGFDLRLVYSVLEPRDCLHTQFGELWKTKRRLIINRRVHERHFARYCKTMPNRIEKLIIMLSEASGLSRHDLIHHDNFLQAFSFTRLVESYRPHYLHSYFFYDRSLMSLVAGYLLDIPRGISCYADHLLQDYDLKVVPLHLQLCDVVVATSERIKKELLEIAPNADPDRIIVKPNAVDVRYLPVVERHEPDLGQPFRLACVSRVEPKKGLLYLVEAVSILRNGGLCVELHLVGAPDEGVQASQVYKRELDGLITSLNLWGKVHLEGRQNQEGVFRFLELSHLFVAPFIETETGDKDGIPTALLEAMATGLPVVATDAGSIPEVIEDGREGIIVPQRNAFALAGAIEAVLRDPARRRQMGSAAAEKARRQFDVGVCESTLHERVRATIKTRFPSS